MKRTPEQEAAVTTFDRDLCVVAGAGSGKTSVLTARFAHLVVEHDVAVDRILALTFTDKAALQMRERVARALGETEGVTRARREELRRSVETAWISTFHGFCARLLKENAIEAGVDPAFGVLTELEASLLVEESVAEVVARAHEGEGPDPFAPLADLQAADITGLLGGLMDRVRTTGRSARELFGEELDPPPPAAAVAALRERVAEVAAVVENWGGKTVDKGRALVAAAAPLASLPPGDAEAAGVVATAIRAAFTLQVQAVAKPLLAEVREACDAVLDAALAHRAVPVAEALVRLLEETATAYAARRRALHRLDFADLEQQALGLLQSRPDVADEIRRRWDQVMVDEHQDTNPVQAALLDRITRRDRRFTVGDPKQAIYGFRGADHSGFLVEQERVGDAGTVRLAANFRSRPEVLSFVNAALAPVFAAQPEQVDWMDLEPGASFEPKPVPSVEVLRIEPGDGESLADRREHEAARLAERLDELVRGATPLQLTREERVRPVRWGDCAVLLRVMSDVKRVERALVARDIPVQVVKGRGFHEAREVVDLINLLVAVDDPSDELALAAALRSPFGGLDDDALLALCNERDRRRRATRRPSLRLGQLVLHGGAVAGLAPHARAAFDDARELLLRLRALRGRGRLVEAVDAAIEASGYDLQALLRPNGRQAAANLRKLRETARTFAADGGLSDFLRAVRRLRLRETPETEAPLADEDAVVVMTVHQAKGLEWPVVAVPDMDRKPRDSSDPVLLTAGGAAVRLRGGRGGVPTPGYRRLAQVQQARDAAERQRVLHVALTRAEEHLLLSAAVSDRENETWWRLLPDAVRGVELLDGDDELPAETPVPADRLVDVEGHTVRLRRFEGAGAAAGSAAGSILDRSRADLLAGRGPGADPAPAVRAAAGAEVAAVLALPPIAAPDDEPFLVTVSEVLDRAADREAWIRRHRIGVPDRLPPAVAEALGPDLPPGERRPDGLRADPPILVGAPDPARREALPGADDEDPVAGDDDAFARGEIPRWVLGVAAHAVLAHLDFANDPAGRVREQMRARIEETLGYPPPDDAVARAVAWVEALRGSDLGRTLAAARRRDVLREVPFLLRGPGPLVRGQVDLVLRRDDGSLLVADWKTSRRPRPERERRYEDQVRIYQIAIARAVPGDPGTEGAIVYLDDPDGVVVHPCPPADADFEQELDRWLGLFADAPRAEGA